MSTTLDKLQLFQVYPLLSYVESVEYIVPLISRKNECVVVDIANHIEGIHLLHGICTIYTIIWDLIEGDKVVGLVIDI